MQLVSQFREFIRRENLFQQKDKLLLAVSGGVDSVVLCELCRLSGFDFIIAHCNFQLRGEESERDEVFVKSLGERYNTSVMVKRFDTELYAKQHKCSIQVAARDLRYAWFQEILNSSLINTHSVPEHNKKNTSDNIRQPSSGKYIVTAHHADDNIETMLMNFFKGTGITGMRGMLPKQGQIVRPLLFASKQQLKKFAEENHLSWVEDSSNAQEKYSRNFIRHKILPVISEIYPQAESNLANSIHRFREIENLYRQSIDQLIKKLVERKGVELHIPVLKLKKTNAVTTILFELTHPLGFTPKQAEEAAGLIDSETGKYISSETHRIFKNRNWLIIAPLETTVAENILIEEHTRTIRFAGGVLNFSEAVIDDVSNSLKQFVDRKEIADPKSKKRKTTSQEDNRTVFIDASVISFPLLLRKWKQGDYFYPLGMRKKKKLARFFIDLKLSTIEKEKVWVIESDKKIVWVVGYRIDDRYKITDYTDRILKINWD
ncbi:MAG TPA: tRNA lysidine(34) synthetase TilS [Chitinophagaceae bacterium]